VCDVASAMLILLPWCLYRWQLIIDITVWCGS